MKRNITDMIWSLNNDGHILWWQNPGSLCLQVKWGWGAYANHTLSANASLMLSVCERSHLIRGPGWGDRWCPEALQIWGSGNSQNVNKEEHVGDGVFFPECCVMRLHFKADILSIDMDIHSVRDYIIIYYIMMYYYYIIYILKMSWSHSHNTWCQSGNIFKTCSRPISL